MCHLPLFGVFSLDPGRMYCKESETHRAAPQMHHVETYRYILRGLHVVLVIVAWLSYTVQYKH